MKQKYWEILLCEWKKMGRSGFTIPFLLGSQEFFGFENHQNIASLLDDIIDTNTTNIKLKYCITTEDIILEVHNPQIEKLGFYPKHRGKDQSVLFVTSFFEEELGKTCEEISECMHNRYDGYIKAGQYSKNGRSRSGFLADERLFIKRCVDIFSKYGQSY